MEAALLEIVAFALLRVGDSHIHLLGRHGLGENRRRWGEVSCPIRDGARSVSVSENGHFNADFRDANASGTVSDGTTNFTPSPSVFAQTMSAKEVDVTITHP